MTSICILGSGRVGSALAAGLANAGHKISVGTRDAEAARARWTGPAVTFATPAEAIGGAGVVVNATPGDTSLERLSGLSAALEGKILVDVSNATERGPDGAPSGLCYPNSSLAEKLQAALPGARVVKTLNTVLFTVMAQPKALAGPASVFVSGEDAAAKAVVSTLLKDLGWSEAQIVDLGGVESARGAEALILMAAPIMRQRGFKPFAVTVVW